MTTTTTTTQGPAAEVDSDTAIGAFAERVVSAAIGSFELATIELGMRLGLYHAMAAGMATAPELAQQAGIDARRFPAIVAN
jgi:uncharacterized membrane protein YgdD (TMEM256/DUF423 family)